MEEMGCLHGIVSLLLEPVLWLIYGDGHHCRRASFKPERTWRPYIPEEASTLTKKEWDNPER